MEQQNKEVISENNYLAQTQNDTNDYYFNRYKEIVNSLKIQKETETRKQPNIPQNFSPVETDTKKEIQFATNPNDETIPFRTFKEIGNFLSDKVTTENVKKVGKDIAKGTWSTEQKIYDSFGNEHMLNVSFTRVVGNPNQWQATVTVDPDMADESQTRVGLGTTDGQGNTFLPSFRWKRGQT